MEGVGLRIVSLCPSITKLVFDLGRGKELVGLTRYCTRPEDGVAGIEQLGGTKNPDVKRILELAPDLVLLNEEENRREDWTILREAGLSCLVTFPRTIDHTLAAIAEIAGALERPRAGQKLIEAIGKARGEVRRKAVALAGISWAYLIWRKPWMTINGATYIHALLAEAGGINVFEKMDAAYPSINSEQLAQADPTLVLLSSEPFPFAAKHQQELSRLTGLPAQRFHLVDGVLLSWHASFTEAGLRYASRLLQTAALKKPSG